MYKKASIINLRFPVRGSLAVEDLWKLPLKELDTLAVKLSDKIENTAKKTFLDEVSKEDEITKLQLDIVVDVLKTKQAEMKESREATEIKKHNQKILGMLEESEDKELRGLTPEELRKRLK